MKAVRVYGMAMMDGNADSRISEESIRLVEWE